MPTSNSPTPLSTEDDDSRSERLITEMRVALKAVNRAQMLDWAADATRMTARVFVRRGVGLAKVIANAGRRGTIDEARGAVAAGQHGYLVQHCKTRGAAFLYALKDVSKGMHTKATTFAAMVRNPVQLPEAVVTVVAALVSSGGIDANGGIPDLDLQIGIGAHRSIFTHSIIAGSVVEGSLYGIATLVAILFS